MANLDFPHLMGNVLWSNNGWTYIDPNQKGKSQFSWTKEHPDDHVDGYLFNWNEIRDAEGAYVPFMTIPRAYTNNYNGQGILFIISRNPDDKKYYIVGFFNQAEFKLKDSGRFACNISESVRFGHFIPLDIARHCPLTMHGKPRKQVVGESNFNYLTDEWAKAILQDTILAHEHSSYSSKGCTAARGLLPQDPLKVIRKVYRSYFGDQE